MPENLPDLAQRPEQDGQQFEKCLLLFHHLQVGFHTRGSFRRVGWVFLEQCQGLRRNALVPGYLPEVLFFQDKVSIKVINTPPDAENGSFTVVKAEEPALIQVAPHKSASQLQINQFLVDGMKPAVAPYSQEILQVLFGGWPVGIEHRINGPGLPHRHKNIPLFTIWDGQGKMHCHPAAQFSCQ